MGRQIKVLMFNVVIGLAAVACNLLGEARLGIILLCVLWLSLGIQYWRVRQAVKRHIRAERAWLEQASPQIEQAIAKY